jgi:hypothetical protein
MSKQAPAQEQASKSFERLRESQIERDFQDAMRWRRKLETGELPIGECTKTALLHHFDQLARSATAWRGKAMVG